MVDLIGYGGIEPIAIIFWYNELNEPQCKTVCYEEDDVINMYNRHNNPKDFYSGLRPRVRMIKNEKVVN